MSDLPGRTSPAAASLGPAPVDSDDDFVVPEGLVDVERRSNCLLDAIVAVLSQCPTFRRTLGNCAEAEAAQSDARSRARAPAEPGPASVLVTPTPSIGDAGGARASREELVPPGARRARVPKTVTLVLRLTTYDWTTEGQGGRGFGDSTPTVTHSLTSARRGCGRRAGTRGTRIGRS